MKTSQKMSLASVTMKCCTIFLILAVTAYTMSSAIPKAEEQEHKNRVYDKVLSNQRHYTTDDEIEEAHNLNFDHDAFLGHDEAEKFEDLTPEQSQEQLGVIYDKIDKDNDGLVTEEELKNWILYVQNKYVEDDSKKQWEEHEHTNDGLSWDSYKKRTYGFINDGEDDDDEEDAYDYKQMVDRDEKRWKRADLDNDGTMSFDEFSTFLHPEDSSHMRDIVVDETMEDIDKDGDGMISLAEYIGDMWPNQEEEEPDWVVTEREEFSNVRDKNRDGYMNRDEVADWIMPPEYDHPMAEAKHLISSSDEDHDGKLTKEEVVTKFDLFVGSQATDFGEALTRHDEF